MHTNYSKWLKYNEELVSPNNYIQWGWLSLISSCLQRRVWLSASHKPCYANMYVILVGKPGIGKGLVLGSVSDCLKYWKRENIKIDKTGKTESEAQLEQVNFDRDTVEAKAAAEHGLSKKQPVAETLLFPMAPDATTYEALVAAVSRSYRRVNYKKPDGNPGIYGHSSMSFVLPELSSLMRKKTEDTINYLLGVYDSPEDYEYDTRTRGRERVKRGCINILAGTTPSFVQSTFESKLIDEGWTSRVFYIFAHRNRHHQFCFKPLTQEQKDAQQVIVDHVKRLSTIYGEVRISKETLIFLEAWWNNDNDNTHLRPNKSTKMEPYYARKNLHIMKVAMALHFGESLEMEIPLSVFERAIKILDEEERTMHLALVLAGDHPVAKASTRILNFLSTGRKHFVEILIECGPYVSKRDIQDAIEFLQETEQIECTLVDEGMREHAAYYKLKPKNEMPVNQPITGS